MSETKTISVCTGATFKWGPLQGWIRVTAMHLSTPILYEMTLFHVKDGFIKTKVQFDNVEKAIGNATLHGFDPSFWQRNIKSQSI